MMEALPQVLFVCVHNAGRSQMAAALLEEIHPSVVEAMRERGIDLSGRRPSRLRDETVREADVVITMGCGDECPYYPGKRYEDWDLPDPADRPIEEVRAIRDEIERRVGDLL